MTALMDADRVLADLRELARLTGGPDGARRVCWTDEWVRAREFLRSRLDELPVTVTVDAAGNLWADLPGEREDAVVVVGSHSDSVPNGGWLDGALGIYAAVEALRAHAADGRPAVSLRLVDWADEEGARFGRSLFGSSACAGTLDPDAVRDLRDRDGERLQDVVARHGVDLDRAGESSAQLQRVCAYLELHIEQGPVLESRGEPAATVLGTCGVERHVAVFTGQAAHAGATPMGLRRDSFAATAQAALAIRDIGFRHDGVCTVGGATSEPGVVTAVAGRTEMLLDQRHLDPDKLAAMLAEARAACEQAAADHGCEVELRHLWSIPPIPFDERLIALARASVVQAGGQDTAIPSGPLHDAAEMARHVPTVMLFSSSSPPVSHTKEEDTPEGDLRVAIEAYGRTVTGTLELAASGELSPRGAS
jgi:N-carbamoyl-L-amino-acid hydrolase